jgi:hypothetical protein
VFRAAEGRGAAEEEGEIAAGTKGLELEDRAAMVAEGGGDGSRPMECGVSVAGAGRIGVSAGSLVESIEPDSCACACT